MTNQLPQQTVKRIEEQAIEKYCSPYGKANPETYAYISGATSEALRQIIPGDKKPFIVANVRDIIQDMLDDETSYSRMVERLNEVAANFYASEAQRNRELVEALEGMVKEFEKDYPELAEWNAVNSYAKAKQALKNYQQ